MKSNSLWPILARMQDKKLFSFDIFDTLVTRLTSTPQELFKCVERRALTQNLDADGFSEKRPIAEERARRKTSGEISLDDIYAELSVLSESADLDKIKNLEIQAEIDLCVAIPSAVEAYNQLISEGKTVILTSDMYLPKEVIEEILQENGIGNYRALFLSSEIGHRKDSGELFRYLAKSIDQEFSDIVHIGDNPISDISIPRSLGIATLQVNSGSVLFGPSMLRKVKKKISRKTAENENRPIAKLDSTKDPLDSFGFRTLGPLLFSFSNWLHQEVTNEGIDEILFMSRDGLLLKKAYDILFPQSATTYVYGSRRALIIPTLHDDASINVVLEVFPLVGTLKLSSFIERIGLSYDAISSAAESFGYSADTKVDSYYMLNDENFRSFYSKIEPIIRKNAAMERSACIRYLESIFDKKGKYAFVDIGWTGYMQKALCDLLKEEIPGTTVLGFFTGLRPNWPLTSDDNYSMKGFLFGNNLNEEASARQQIYNELYEVIFSADHGTVGKFVLNEDGTPEPVLLANERTAQQQEKVTRIQDAALLFVNLAKSRNLQLYFDFSPESIIKEFERVGLTPSFWEAQTLGDFCIYESGVFKLVDLRSLWQYVKRPQLFAEDFTSSRWKPGFLKAALHITIPYVSLKPMAKRLKTALSKGNQHLG